jgi:hypothetical protein
LAQVQEAACSAVATLEDEARDLLTPYLRHIVAVFAQALDRYQVKRRRGGGAGANWWRHIRCRPDAWRRRGCELGAGAGAGPGRGRGA